jgi:long-chain acyl-CoA synthetase
VNYLETIFDRLRRAAAKPVLGEVRDGKLASVSGTEMLALIEKARAFTVACGLKTGDRCALYAPNSIRWVALDLALMAQGVVVVPLDPRQVSAEIGAVVRDSAPSLVFCSDDAFARNLPPSPEIILFEKVFAGADVAPSSPLPRKDEDPVTIIYTSGTSGEQKGVIITAANITFMLGCTNARLDALMGARTEPDRIFQYAPFWSGAARILLLTSLSRNSMLTLSTDLTKLSDELKVAQPNYFVNVPLFLERVRRRVEESIAERRGFAARVFNGARRSYFGEGGFADALFLKIANAFVFPAIRKSVGPNVKALICGSAPLAVETQTFFMMLGIPVLQAYGLTETTAICTMDDPAGSVEPGRVGRAVPGVEMKVAEDGEILVRGPNIFAGYWQRVDATEKVMAGGWFHTGDQGDVDATGNWRITGRLKNLVILNSGHNVAPEPLEEKLAAILPEARQVMLAGNRKNYLTALITMPSANGMHRERVQSALDTLNADLPHYKQVRGFHVLAETFSAENGLLTTMGKLKREAIAARFAGEIESVYANAKRSA